MSRPSAPRTAEESPIAVYGAIAANVAIAITKFIVAAVTGSSAMLSEAIHSSVDTFNGVLLLVGLRRSKKPATAEHPFGHGKELYFWSLIVAVLIFGLGGGFSLYEGVQHILHPVPMVDATWNYVVLGAAFLFEGSSFIIALRTFLREKGATPFWKAIHASKDPTTYTVMAEDSAALAGLLVAAAGIYLSHAYGLPQLDGVASVLIGLLLAGVAVLLVREARGLLIGEGIRPETAQQVRAMALAMPGVARVGRIQSMYLGPHEVLVTVEMEFSEGALAVQAGAAVLELEKEVRERYPMIQRLFIGAAVGQGGAVRQD